MSEPLNGGDEEPAVDAGPGNPDRPPDGAERRYRPTGAQWAVAGAIVAFGAGFVLYHVLKGSGLGQSAALYVGIPLVLAVVLTLTSPARRPAGMAMKVTTILLLLSIPVLGEGACCVLLAAPIFYLFVYVGATQVATLRARRQRGPAVFVLPALLMVMALEGTTPWLTMPGDATVSASRVVEVPADQFATALAAPLQFDDQRPGGVLAIGFPNPTADSGGLDVGTRRVIRFSGAHHRHGPTVQHHWGTAASALTLEVTSRTASSVSFRAAADSTPLATWLRWRDIRVTWDEVDAVHTRVRWELGYTRLLSPAWYFGPIERVVTGRAADYLISAIDVGAATGGPSAPADPMPAMPGMTHA